MTQVVGAYEQSKSNFGFVIPDNTKIAQDIFVPKEWSKGAMTGHKVVVEITGYGTNTKSPEGKVVEILGHINDPGVDIMSIVRGFDLPVEFGEKIMNQVERVSQEVSEADCAGRRGSAKCDHGDPSMERMPRIWMTLSVYPLTGHIIT